MARNMTPTDFLQAQKWLATHVHTLNKRFGRAFYATPDAPSTLPDVTRAWETTGPVPVFDGGSVRTVYGSRRANYAFRAWHDTTHVNLQTPFTPEGERETARAQVRQIIGPRAEDLGTAEQRVKAARLLWEEIVGQVEYFERHGAFPEDQLAFQICYACFGKDAALARTF